MNAPFPPVWCAEHMEPYCPRHSPENDAAALHLRDHLTDGVWHDGCGYCQHRRVHGGTGVARVIPPGEGS